MNITKHLHRRLRSVLITALTVAFGTAAAAERPFLFFDANAMTAAKKAYAEKEPKVTARVGKLIEKAERDLRSGPFSVTFKKRTAASGDKHDYYSVGQYYWPDPSMPDGLPYIRKDGQTNPIFDCDDFDFGSLRALDNSLNELALAFYFTGREDFSRYAVKLIRVWFLDADTRMNPHGQYAQAVLGLNTGRSSGMIDLYKLSEMIDPIIILLNAGALTGEEERAITAWFGELKKWMNESEFGKKEVLQENNHGVWCKAQLASYAIFSGDRDLARRLIDAGLGAAISAQIEDDGRMPAELARTRPIHYVFYALLAFVRLAQMGENFFETPYFSDDRESGRRFRKALTWALPYVKGEKQLSGDTVLERDKSAYKEASAMLIYRLASVKFGMKGYQEIFDELTSKKTFDISDFTLP